MERLSVAQLNKIRLLYGSSVEQIDSYYVSLPVRFDDGDIGFKLITSNGVKNEIFIKRFKHKDNFVFCETYDGRIYLTNQFGVFNISISKIESTTYAEDLALIRNENEQEFLLNNIGKLKKISNKFKFSKLIYFGNGQYGLLKFAKSNRNYEPIDITTYSVNQTFIKHKDNHERVLLDVVDTNLKFIKRDIELNDTFAYEYGINKVEDLLYNTEYYKLRKPIQ